MLEAAAAAGVTSLVHVSSIGALGAGTAARPADERTPRTAQRPPTATTGARSTPSGSSAEFCAAHPGVRVATVLPGWMWGPGDAGPTSSGRLFLAIASGDLPGIPDAAMHVVDARDVADACVRAAVRGDGRYVVAGVKRPMREVAAAVARTVGVPPLRPVPPRLALAITAAMEWRARRRGVAPAATREGVHALIEGRGRHISSAKAVDELGISFRDLDDTMRDIAAWYRERGMVPA